MNRIYSSFSSLMFLIFLLAVDAGLAFAQDGTAQQPGAVAKLFMMLPMFVIVFFIFYIMVHLPANKEAKLHSDLLNSLKKGEQVVTSSGMIGRVAGIEKDYILLEVAQNVKVKVEPSAVKRRKD